MKLRLKILHNTKETDSLDKMDLDFSYSDLSANDMTFYNINAISEYIDNDGISYTEIHSNGSVFVSPENIKKVEELIDEASMLFQFLS